MQRTAYYAPITGRSSYGDPTFGSATAVKVRDQQAFEVDRKKGSGGSEQRAEVVLYAYAAVPIGARFWLPGVTRTAQNARKVLQAGIHRSSTDGHVLYKIRLSNTETI